MKKLNMKNFIIKQIEIINLKDKKTNQILATFKGDEPWAFCLLFNNQINKGEKINGIYGK